MKNLKFAHSFEVVRELPEPLQPLRKLAYNFRWCWHPESLQLFSKVDPHLWQNVHHNPVELLNQLSEARQQRLCRDEAFLALLKACEKDLDQYMADETWFSRKYPDADPNMLVAYFCAEFGLHESLPIYSGGLGVLAGDHLKAASDLGIPLVGVGLLYSRGYFRQYLSPDGWQQERYPVYDFYRMPLKLIRGADHEPIRVSVDFPDRTVVCQLWKAQVGRVELILLDSNVLENEAADQGITDTLYGGDEEMRIRQELILGIGGYRALTALGKTPTVCHMNEGHAAFLSLERIRQFMAEHQCDYRTARQCVVAGNVFTTHTPVPAGFDKFALDLVSKYLTKSVGDLGLSLDEFSRMGRVRPEATGEPFNMAILAMENANFINGVSKLHAKVTREMFHERWPHYPVEEVPIDAITNGVHTPSWLGRRMAALLDRHFGPDWREDPSSPELWQRVSEIPDRELWDTREDQRGDFVRYTRDRLQRIAKRNQMSPHYGHSSTEILDPRVLTIGFARRFATYKRATLLFQDRERLKQLIFHPERPVQFVFAGKAHPRDEEGKRLIQQIVSFIKHENAASRMVFLEDYDMDTARNMVQGIDVWLNNPRRPMEASGTSGMKIVPNGGLNCSILDGWWAEGYQPGTGWAIGDGVELHDHGYQDWLEAQNLYHLIENEITPHFYHRTDGGVPASWLDMMKRSMRELAPVFSTSRMVREYATRYYVRSHDTYQRMVANKLERAKNALVWRDRVRKAWNDVKVIEVWDDAQVENRLGAKFNIKAKVSLGSLPSEDVRVQVLLGQVGSNRELTNLDLHDLQHKKDEGDLSIFEGTIDCGEPGHRGYVVRIVPENADVRVPAELQLAAWEHAD